MQHPVMDEGERLRPLPFIASRQINDGCTNSMNASSSFGAVTAVLAVACAIVGLAVGSFLNVVIYRVPRKESVISPRSRCPQCGTQLAEYDNIPVVSWLVLRGKCRTCKNPIS